MGLGGSGKLRWGPGLAPREAPMPCTASLRFWPAIDDGLRRAAYERGVRVRLLVSCWGHSDPSMRAFLLSLAALRDNHTHSDIQVVSAHPSAPVQGRTEAWLSWGSPVIRQRWTIQNGQCLDGETTGQGQDQGHRQRGQGRDGGAQGKCLLQTEGSWNTSAHSSGPCSGPQGRWEAAWFPTPPHTLGPR